jgi:hypothetical protein
MKYFMNQKTNLNSQKLYKLRLLLILFLLANSNIHSQTYQKRDITQLAAAIHNKVLSEVSGGYKLIVESEITASSLNHNLKNEFLRSHIKSAFNINDDTEVNHIIENHIDEYPLFKNKLASISSDHIIIINKEKSNLSAFDYRGIYKINSLLVLVNKEKNKCIVYYHIIDQGRSIAVLEKKGRNWELIDSIEEYIE